jgi:P-type Ca2+ transporter type 2C
MGETGTEMAKQAAVMILTDDNFSTITKAVEIGHPGRRRVPGRTR